MDLVFTVEAIENYVGLQPSESLSNILMDVTSNLMKLPWHYLRKSDEDYRSCSKLINVMEGVALGHPATLFQRVMMRLLQTLIKVF